jgi:hypothetical protein
MKKNEKYLVVKSHFDDFGDINIGGEKKLKILSVFNCFNEIKNKKISSGGVTLWHF